MKKTIAITTLLLLSFPVFASAETVDSRARAREKFRVHLNGEIETPVINTTVDVETETEQESEIAPTEKKPLLGLWDNFQTRIQAHREDLAGNLGVRERIEIRREQLLEGRIEIKARLETKTKEKVDRLVKHIFEKFKNISDRFDHLNEKITAHIENFENNGVDVTGSIDLFAKAEAQLEATKGVMAEAEISLQAELGNEVVSRDNIKATVETVKESVRTTHQAYVDVLVSLKASVKTDQ